jgi:hypothetical protein
MKKEKSENRQGEPKKRPKIRLERPCDVKRLLNRSINEVITKEMGADTLRSISYSCSVILKIFELERLEARLDRIEQLLAKR